MRTRRIVAVLGLLAICAWSPRSGGATAPPDPLSQPGSVQLAIGASPPEVWKVATVGAKFDIGGTPPGQTVTKRGLSRVTIRGFVSGEGGFAVTFDTDLSRDVTRIEPITLSFDSVETMDAVQRRSTFTPGALRPSDVTFTLARPSPATADWVKTTLAGAITKRDVTITVRDARQPTIALRTIVLQRCLPTTYSSSGAVSVISIRPEAVQVKATSHQPVFEWLGAYLAGNPSRREVKVSFLDGARRVISAPVLKEAVLTEVAWSAFDVASPDSVSESLVVQPNQIDPMP